MNNKLYIGDNLTVLKQLETNSIDTIYTDPPYLTGNSKLTYKDNKSESEWIEFMRERLIECKRVMKPTSTMLIHIDENMHIELANLCYQVFGKKNHITTFVWKKRSSGSAQSKFATVEHEYIIAVAKDIKHCKWNGIPQFEQKDKNLNFDALLNSTGNGPNTTYPIYHGDDPNDITTELRHTSQGKSNKSGPNQNYPLYHGDDPNDTQGKFDIIGDNPKPQTSQIYPLYYNEQDQVGEYTLNGTTFEATRNTSGIPLKERVGMNPNATYPLHYSKQDNIDQYAESEFNQHGASREKGNENNHYKLHIGKFEGNKPHFKVEVDEELNDEFYHHPLMATDGASKSRPKSDDKYPIYTDKTKISLTPFPGSKEIYPMNGTEKGCWRCIPTTCQKLIDADMLVVKNNKIYQKQYASYAFDKKTGTLVPHVRTTPIRTILTGDKYPTNLRSNKEIKEIFGKSSFTYAKPKQLVKSLLEVVSNKGDTVLDIFAGSGTTGQAAFELGRNFILIQLDEGDIPNLIKIRFDKTIGKDNYETILFNN